MADCISFLQTACLFYSSYKTHFTEHKVGLKMFEFNTSFIEHIHKSF